MSEQLEYMDRSALLAEVNKMKDEVKVMRQQNAAHFGAQCRYREEMERQAIRATIAEGECTLLREALKPFVENWSDEISGHFQDHRTILKGYTVGDLRRAAEVLKGGS